LFCAGGMGGLGPYIIARCSELGIKTCAYVDHFKDKTLDNFIPVTCYPMDKINEFENDVEAFVLASTGFASNLIKEIEKILGKSHPPFMGNVNYE
jgi:hypothetical protein